ncbi:MAG: formate dehydrogenase subunit delta [Burkholderiaceae bacterium]
MDLDNLVRMANRIGAFFEAQPDRGAALAGIADHLKKFWDPRMRVQILAALESGAETGLSDIVAEALRAHRALLTPA